MTPGDTSTKDEDQINWLSLPLDQVFESVGTEEEGLSTEQAVARLEEYGYNEIQREEGSSVWELLLSQFQDFLIYILVFAALLSLGIGLLPGFDPHYTDAILILLILLANGLFGFIQDYQAEQSIEALRELSSPDATVLRDGNKITIDSRDLVPGDIIYIEQGNAIPADARLIEASSLETNESALTGESATVPKSVGELASETPLAERSNMVYMNTAAVRGRGQAVVTETGMTTEVGGIATQLEETEDEQTPFQAEVDLLGRQIGYGVILLIVMIAGIQFFFTNASLISILLVGVTLAVAAVPEGLPAVVTLTLALGSRRMAERNALVRRLPVVESLGSVDVIVTDKTGTLTENQMTVRRLYASGDTYTVTGAGTDVSGEFRTSGEPIDPVVVEQLLRCGAICNNAEKAPDSEGIEYYGDPTEVAILISAAKAGIHPDHERLREIPFSSDRKRMTVIANEESTTAFMKGAPEEILERCDRIMVDDQPEPLTDAQREKIVTTNDEFASDALRVLGFAKKEITDPEANEEAIEQEMVFLGLQGMIDPPRDEVDEAVTDCRDAGIRVVMVTGDNIGTAKAIGTEIGFDPAGALTGQEVESLSESELSEVVEHTEIFARASPAHKVRIMDALQANDHNVAMTGDGVNDAPALRSADVGIAMGIRGTDVAQQASDMVLQDDNFVTIRDAIAEGRGIFDNIRKFVNYLLSANAGEVLVVFVGFLIGTALFPTLFASRSEALILTPVMLLWINLVTDGLPALALGADPKAENILDRPPRSSDEPVINRRILASIITIGVMMTITGLVLFFYGLQATADIVRAQTLLFTFLVVAEIVRIQAIRARYDLSLLSNKWLIGAIVITLTLQLLVLYTPLNTFFVVRSLALTEWTSIGLAFLGFLVLNLGMNKYFDRVFSN